MLTDPYTVLLAAYGLEFALGVTAHHKEKVGACGMYIEQRNPQRIFVGNQKETDHSEKAGDIIKTDRKEISLDGVNQISLVHDCEIIFVD